MTLKYNQGHWKWYGCVELKEYYHHAKFDIYHLYSKKIAMLKFLPHVDNRKASQPNTDHYIESHFSCESKNDKEIK